jgi:predicted ABC-type ATPase
MRQWARGGQKRKGRAEIGEIRERKGGKYKKVGSRKWIRLPKGQKPDGEKRPEPGTVEREIKKGEKQPLTAGQKRLIATQEKRLGKLKDQRKYVGYGNKGLEENIKDETAKLEKLKSKFEAAPVVSRKPDEPPPVKSFAEKVRQEREFSEALKGHPKAKKISGKYAIRLPAWAKKQLPEDLQKSSYSISALNRHEKWKILSVLDRGPAAKSKMGKLSATHQKVLEEAERSGSIRTGTGKGTIRQLSALAERGLLESKAGGGYSLTEAGAEALESGKYDRGAKAEPVERAPRSTEEWVKAARQEGKAAKRVQPESYQWDPTTGKISRKPKAKVIESKNWQTWKPETFQRMKDPLPEQVEWTEEAPAGLMPTSPEYYKEPPGNRGGTEQMNWDTKANDYTPERRKFHDALIESHFAGKELPKPNEQKMAIVMAGGTGSGKSTMLKATGMGGPNYVHVDADAIKSMLPEYREAIRKKYRGAAGMAHEESSTLSKRLLSETIDRGNHVVMDGTGKNAAKYERMINRLKDAGYKVHVMMPDQDAEVAKRGALARAETAGRYVPMGFINEAYKEIPKNFHRFAKLADSAQLFDQRRKGKLVWEKTPEGKVTDHDPEFTSKYPGLAG